MPHGGRRFIPAGAGYIIFRINLKEPIPGSSPQVRGTCRVSSWYRMQRTVHPRRCGVHVKHKIKNRAAGGSSPQVRGTYRPIYPKLKQTAVHPRRCGVHERIIDTIIPPSRFIPAGAGYIGQ